MDSLRELYQDVILDHGRNPRNFRELEGASHEADGFNPLCGDQLSLRVRVDEERDQIGDIAFQGTGCVISTASASLLTSTLKGKSLDEAHTTFARLHRLLTEEVQVDPDQLGKLVVFSGVRQFPARVKCASLAWHTLQAALNGDQNTVSTE